MGALPSDVQLQEIAAIVRAVNDGHGWRTGVLLDRFVVGADLPALLALREALDDGLSDQPRRG
ncbi:hypothetical protein [Streptomyces sp. NBC_00212]|uniref:hypothetical protein n=1 Tax=Streptomyces sp. NBC_00212 TaxID=2975684 RepID=UPI00324B21EC